jgi:D-glycero-beta-D-manno-heptose-7-phosphate kinase
LIVESSHTIRNIPDVSGAGDTVIAVTALVYAASRDVALMAVVANIAGGLVCDEVRYSGY